MLLFGWFRSLVEASALLIDAFSPHCALQFAESHTPDTVHLRSTPMLTCSLESLAYFRIFSFTFYGRKKVLKPIRE
jgi:hypothetical protein